MLQALLAFPLVLFLPGFTLVNLLFPRKGEIDREYDALYRITLGVVMSIVVVVLLGFVLQALGVTAAGTGYFTAEVLWPALLGITIAFFAAGWWRGAYPMLGRVHPLLKRPLPREPASILGDLETDRAVLTKLRELAGERESLRKQVKDAGRRVALHTGSLKDHYEAKRLDLQKKLKGIDDALAELETDRAKELY
jgi:hypothetical protein